MRTVADPPAGVQSNSRFDFGAVWFARVHSRCPSNDLPFTRLGNSTHIVPRRDPLTYAFPSMEAEANWRGKVVTPPAPRSSCPSRNAANASSRAWAGRSTRSKMT